jgi:diguanylate cyclase (GGDEF)-like protein
MFWLTSISNVVAGLAFFVAIAAVAWSLLRLASARLMLPGCILMFLVVCAIILGAVAETLPTGIWRNAVGLVERLVLLAVALLVWPLLRQFGLGGSPVAREQAQLRLEVARAEASESRQSLRLAEKIARVGHWRYTIGDRRLDWSEEVFSIFGAGPEDGTPNLEYFFGLIGPAERERAVRDFENAILNAMPFEFTVRVARHGREDAYVTARGIPEFDHSGKVVALFGVFVDITAQKRIEDELKTAHHASEVSNRALEALARHDALTRLPNRRHFDEMIGNEFKRAMREQQPVGLIIIDLDHFKTFNDQYGHPAGDSCLRRVAEAIASVPQRPADLVARYGGEELVVLLPNTDLHGTETVADLLVQAVRQLHIPHAGNPEQIVTISCGAAIYDAEISGNMPVIRLLERADEALYRAKRSGRNRAMSHAMAA